jgi:uncharacterized metal-binding protein YceD (DUF177 family)
MIPEFSRWVDARQLPAELLCLEADDAERAALAERFGLEAIARLEAEVSFEPDGQAVLAQGRVEADVVQTCAVSGDPFPTRVAEPIALRFVPGPVTELGEVEIEIDADDWDEIPFEGAKFDLGEAIAQSLGLAIDPYATGPNAEQIRKEVGLADEPASGPFAALAALKGKGVA